MTHVIRRVSQWHLDRYTSIPNESTMQVISVQDIFWEKELSLSDKDKDRQRIGYCLLAYSKFYLSLYNLELNKVFGFRIQFGLQKAYSVVAAQTEWSARLKLNIFFCGNP